MNNRVIFVLVTHDLKSSSTNLTRFVYSIKTGLSFTKNLFNHERRNGAQRKGYTRTISCHDPLVLIGDISGEYIRDAEAIRNSLLILRLSRVLDEISRFLLT